jgi:DNA excision repair protein ERCC-4
VAITNWRTTELYSNDIQELDESQLTFEDNAEDYFELYDNENLVPVIPYDGDMDDRVLEEIKPRYVVMYEPNPAFIRRVEVPTCYSNLPSLLMK